MGTTITILTENRANRRGLLAEHGLSLLLQTEGHQFLFDAGQSDVFVRNAAFLGLDLSRTEAVILSHGHYDHAGGLPHFPLQDAPVPLYAHNAAFLPKFAENADHTNRREVGLPWKEDDLLQTRRLSIIKTGAKTTFAPNLHLLAEVPYKHAFEHHPVGFLTETEAGLAPDNMRDEQMLVLETSRGLTVLLGCGHPGVINCLDAVRLHFPGQPIDTVIGGMHLHSVGRHRVDETCRRLAEMEIRQVLPLHCTGIEAICTLERRLGMCCRALSVGDVIEV